MKQRKRVFGVSAALVVACLLMPSLSSAAIACYSCQDCTNKLQNGNHVYLAWDISDSGLSMGGDPPEACITIDGDYARFNGNGKTIVGSIGRPYGILVKANHVTVENVEVINFGDPEAQWEESSTPYMNPLTGQVAIRNSAHCDLIDVTTRFGRNGIVVYGAGSYDNDIEGCYAYDSNQMGIALWYGAHDNTIYDSEANSNENGMAACQMDGEQHTTGNRIELSRIYYNDNWNLCFCSGSTMNRLEQTVILHHWDGGESNKDIHNLSGSDGKTNTCNPWKVLNWKDEDRIIVPIGDPLNGCFQNSPYSVPLGRQQ